MKYRRFIGVLFLSLSIAATAVNPDIVRYETFDNYGELCVDTLSSSIKVEISAVSSDRHRFGGNASLGMTFKWNVDGDDCNFMRLAEPRYNVGECYAVVVGQVDSAREIIVDSVVVNSPFSRYPEAMFSLLDFSDGMLHVYTGNSQLKHALALPMDKPTLPKCVVNGKGVVFDCVAVETQKAASSDLLTDIDEETIRRHAELTGDPLEGIWEYFDRDTDDSRAMFGGRYRLGILKDDGGCYQVVYLGGATVNSSCWRQGMLKGRITATPFSGQYNLTWYDSAMQQVEIDVDAYAVLENTKLLRLSFPLYNASLRLSKQ